MYQCTYVCTGKEFGLEKEQVEKTPREAEKQDIGDKPDTQEDVKEMAELKDIPAGKCVAAGFFELFN